MLHASRIFYEIIDMTRVSRAYRKNTVRLKLIESYSVVVIEVLFFAIAPLICQVECKVVPVLIIPSQDQHRPIATEHDTLRAEALHDMFRINSKLVETPVLKIRLGQQSGYFAVDVLELRHFSDLGFPGFERARLQGRSEAEAPELRAR